MKLYRLIFPKETIQPGDVLDLWITFEESTGTGLEFLSTSNIKVTRWGKIEYSYDIEDALLVPAIASFELQENISKSSILDDMLFGPDFVNVSKEAIVEVLLNSDTIFKGRIIEDSIEYNDSTGLLTFQASPKTDVMNKRMVFDEDNVALNPFNYNSNYYYKIVTILRDIYRLVDSSIGTDDITIIHNMLLWGRRDPGGGGTTFYNKIRIEETAQLINPLFFDTGYGIRTCGDILRKLAIDWGCFTGMLTQTKPFFKQLFQLNPNNIQTLDVISRKKGYRYGLIDYVKVKTNIGTIPVYEAGVFTELEDRFISRDSLPGYYWTGSPASNIKAYFGGGTFSLHVNGASITVWPEEGAIYNQVSSGSNYEVVGINQTNDVSARIHVKWTGISGTGQLPASGTMIKVSGQGQNSFNYSSWDDGVGWYQVYKIKNLSMPGTDYVPHGRMLADHWFNFRGQMKNCRVDRFMCRGVSYNFLRDFIYNTEWFQPIKMTTHLADAITEIEAIYVGVN